MLTAMPAPLSGRLGTLLSALIVVFSVVGLTMHRDFYAGRIRKDFFCFYTNISNLLVLVYFSLIAPRLYASFSLHPFIPAVEFSVMMSIMLTFSVFHLIIFPSIRKELSRFPRSQEFYMLTADNLLIHYAVPLLVLIYWLFCSPGKSSLRPIHAFIWTLLPLGFVLISLFRAHCGRIIQETGSPYPYPFLDVHALGLSAVLRTCAKLYTLCVLAGLILIVFVSFAGA